MIRPFLSALLLASVAMPSLAGAQAMVQPLPGTTDADRLAAQMRLLAVNANDLAALVTAGELSLRLEDLGAAASFFARAEKIDPRNGRVKAGQAAILVHAERPGEALRYFATAEADGLPPAAFASDRGLAYDLIGEQERAQRDYRLALRTGPPTAPDPETLRRYALSLGISGKRELAEQQLQPLLKTQDRGAWRARAFIEAMTGNGAEASHIATTMMPPGTAAGLQPFFERLPTLGPVDRAFAVHFGEVRSTPQRLADARQAPPLAALGPDPYAPRVQVAAATPPPAGKHRKERRGKQPVQVAVAPAAVEALPQVPAYGAAPRVAAAAPMQPVRGVAPAAWPAATVPTSRPVAVATMPAASTPTAIASAAAERDVTVAPAVTRVAAAPTASLVPATALQPTPQPAPAPVMLARAVPSATPTAVPTAATSAVVTPATATVPPAAAPPLPTAAPVAIASDGIAPTAWPTAITPASPPPTAIAAVPAPASVGPAAAVPAPRHAGSGLADVVGHLSIPAAELGVAAPARPVAEAPASPSAADIAAAERAAAAKALADKKAADRKAAAEKKALAERKAAAAEKAEEAREAAAQKKLERANPERIWVQVAGGAYEGDLPKAWAAAKKKGGDVFAGHATGWTTPLRFTNRVLAGPFKTDEEARAFVNRLKAKGMSGFTFTSDAGQVVKKLDAE